MITTAYRFTGKERDAESGNDYFGARYYGSNMGRFMSPDPSGLFFANPMNPQSLNLYSYAQNNPLINIDPTGLDCVYFNDAGDAAESVDHHSSSGECGKTGGDWVNGTVDQKNVVANGEGGFNITSSDSSNVYYTKVTAPDSSNNANGTCFGNCASDYAQDSLSRIDSMIVTGSLDSFLHWLPLNGAPGHAGAQVPLSWPFDLRTNNYCGPGGAGVPLNGNDWACAVHDYNYNILGAAGKPFAAWTGTGSVLENGVLAQANNNLVNNVDSSAEGRAIKAIFATRRF